MRQNMRQCLAAFAITGILFLGACGFAAVDASTAGYLYNEDSLLFIIHEANAEEIRLSVLGRPYTISWGADTADSVWRYRGILPHSISTTIYLAAKVLQGE